MPMKSRATEENIRLKLYGYAKLYETKRYTNKNYISGQLSMCHLLN